MTDDLEDDVDLLADESVDGSPSADSGYYTQVLAFRVLDALAKRVYTDAIKDNDGDNASRPIVIFSGVDVPEVLARIAALRMRIDMLKRSAKALLASTEAASKEAAPKAPTLGAKFIEPMTTFVAAAAEVVGGLGEIAAFFKTNSTFSARPVALRDELLIAELARVIRRSQPHRKVIIPMWQRRPDDGIVRDVRNLRILRSELTQRRADLRRDQTPAFSEAEIIDARIQRREAQLDVLYLGDPVDQDRVERVLGEIDDEYKERSTAETARLRWEQNAEQFDAVIGAIDTFVETLTSSSEQPSLLETMAVFLPFERYRAVAWLRVELLEPGGEVFVDEKTWSDKIRYLAGAGCLYVYSTPADPALLSGVIDAVKGGKLQKNLMMEELF